VVRLDLEEDILQWMPSSCKDPKSIQIALKAHISSILDIGEILISYGEFLENNRPLATASYVFEWWAEELLRAGADPAGKEKINGEEAIALSRFTGTIGFVGLVAPHITRMVIGGDHRFLLPGSALVGALLLLGADTAARTLLAPVILPVGIMTSFLGVPFFVYLFMKRRKEFW